MEDTFEKQDVSLRSGDSQMKSSSKCDLITCISVSTDIVAGLHTPPARVYVAIDVDGVTTKTSTQSVLIGIKDAMEWDPKIFLPSERSLGISFRVFGFEIGPQVLGGDELLCECKTTVGELHNQNGNLQLSRNGNNLPSPSLRVTLERRVCDIDPRLSAASSVVAPDRELGILRKLPSLFNMGKHSDSALLNKNAAPGIFALIVAIDKYKESEKHKDLIGCERDGERFSDLLTGMLGVPQEQIVFLKNENATRNQILQQYKSHLIDNPAITKGDAMIFFFAGHGTQDTAPAGWLSEDNKMESICPYDANSTGLDGQEIYAIHDRTISGLIRRLASEKGDNIIFIFDCCHSGGATRAADMSSFRGRFTQPSSHPPPMELDQEIWSFMPETSFYGGKRAIKGTYRALESHILLAACRPDEIAWGDKSGGHFTTALLKALKSCSLHNTTYTGLFEKIPKIDDPQYSQHPQCLGGHRDRLLFSTTTVRQGETIHKVFRWGHELYVSAGRIHGVIVGTAFEVQFDKQTMTLGAIEVDAFECMLERRTLSIDFAGAPRSASVSNWNYPMLRVRSSVHQSCAHFIVVPDHEEADIAIRQNGPEWEFERFDPLVLRYSTRYITVQSSSSVHMLRAPIKIANFYSYLYRCDNTSGSFGRDINVRLNRVGGSEDNVEPVGEDLLDVESQRFGEMEIKEAIITDLDAKYCLTVENASNLDLFPYLFYLDPSNYSIQSWYTPPGPHMPSPLQHKKEHGAPSKFAFGYGGFGTSPIEFYLPEGQNSDSGFLKLFLTNAYVELSTVEQNAIDSMRFGNPKMHTPKGIWECKTFVLTCKAS